MAPGHLWVVRTYSLTWSLALGILLSLTQKPPIWSRALLKNVYCFLFKDFIYLFLEGEEGKEKERERNINVWLPLVCPPTGDLAYSPGLYPD